MYARRDAPCRPGVDFKPDENALRFEYALPTYLDESATEYQSRLDGFDQRLVAVDARSAARVHEPRRTATTASASEARGISGHVSDEAVYGFAILPPWYRTWWAYAGYVALFGLVIAGAARVTRMRVVARERQRSQFAEAKLRAEAAESLAKTESEGKKNVELLSEMGREITASLDFETIFGKLYDRVNELADADVFGVGLYHRERNEIEYRLAIEKGKRYAPYTRDTTNRTSCRSGASSIVSRSSSTTSPTEATPLHQHLPRDEPASRGRLDVAAAAVDHLPAARLQGPGARDHHHPEPRARTPTRRIT